MEAVGSRHDGDVSIEPVRTVLCDLDGVVWLARTPVPGSVEAVARLRAAGVRVLFVTNNSVARLEEQEAALDGIGIPARGDVVTSAQAAASLLSPGDRALVCADRGVRQALVGRGVEVVDLSDRVADAELDAVVVGLVRSFHYDHLDRAARAVRGGARFVATNTDATFPTPAGPIPGAGALVAAIATASGRSPVIAGKPHAPMAALVAAVVGPDFDPASTVVIGDRPSTDGAFAATVGCRFVLVRSGVTLPGEEPERGGTPPWRDVADLDAAVGELVGDGHGSVGSW